MTLVVCGALLALFLAPRLFPGDPRKYFDLALQAESEGRIDQAIKYCKEAVRLGAGTVDYSLKMGDLFYKGAQLSPDHVVGFIKQWEQVLEMNPTHKGAAQRLFDAFVEVSEIAPRAAVFDELGRKADKLAQIDPDNLPAQAYRHLALIGQWLHGGRVTDQQVLDAIDKHLRPLMTKAPQITAIPGFLSRAYLRMGEDRLLISRATALDFLDKARQVADDSVAALPDSALLWYRLAGLYEAALVLDQGDSPTVAAEPNPAKRLELQKKSVEQQRKKIEDALAKANELVRPTDRDYMEIRVAQTRQQVSRSLRDREAGLAAMRALVKERPGDQWVRIVLAQTLHVDPDQRAEAVQLLADPVVEQTPLVGFQNERRGHLELQRLVELTELRLDLLGQATDETARQTLRQQIDEHINAVMLMLPKEHALVEELRGRQELARDPNAVYKAIPLLQAAHDKVLGARRVDEGLTSLLAQTYMRAREHGRAAEILGEAIGRRPGAIKLRLLRAQSLQSDGRDAEFRAEVDALEKLAPDHPEVTRFRLQTLDRTRDKDRIAKLLSDLPETNENQRYNKARTAWVVGDTTMAERLLLSVRQVEAFRSPATRLLAQLYVQGKQPDQARKVLQEAIAIKPNPELQATLVLIDKPPEELAKAMWDLLEGIEDPLERQVRSYQLAVAKATTPQARAEAAKYLLDAEKFAPRDVRVLELLFEHYLSDRDWASVAACEDKLAKLNADFAGGTHYHYLACMAQGKLAEALEAAQDLNRKQPKFTRSLLAMARAYHAMGRHEPARDQYLEVLKNQKNNALALRGIIECSDVLRQYDMVRQYIEQARRDHPTDYGFLNMALRFEEIHGNPENTIAAREKILQSRPQVLESWMSLAGAYLTAADRTRIANPARATEHTQKARDRLLEAKAKWPDDSGVYRALAAAYLGLQRGDDAVAVLKEWAARPAWAASADPLLAQADVCTRIGRLDDAEGAYKEAIRLSKDSQPVQMALVRFYMAVGTRSQQQLTKAVALLQQMVATSKDLYAAKFLAELQIRTGELDAADKLLTDLLAQHKEDAALLSLRGLWQMSKNDPAAAEKTLDAALGLDPKCRPALLWRGRIRLADRRTGPGIEDLQRAKAVAPDDFEVRFLLAQAHAQKNDLEEAIREAEEAIRISRIARDARLLLIDLSLRANRAYRAEELLAEAQRIPALASDPIWYVRHAELLGAKDPKLAVAKIGEARKLAPEATDLIYLEARFLTAAGNPREALARLDGAAGKPGTDKDWRLPVHRAVARAALRERDAALSDFDAAINLAKDEATVRLILQQLTASIGAAEAVAATERRAAGEPSWRLLLCNLYYANQQADEADRAITAVLETDFEKLNESQKDGALRIASFIYIATGAKDNWRRAESVMQRYLALLQARSSPDVQAQMAVLNNLASIYADSVQPPRPAEAERYGRAAWELMNKAGTPLAMILDTYGWALVVNNKVPEGISMLSDARLRDPGLVDATYHLAEAYLKLERVDVAMSYIESASTQLADRKRQGQRIDEALEAKLAAAQKRAAAALGKKTNNKG
jgi:predicted Zn-dependent protease